MCAACVPWLPAKSAMVRATFKTRCVLRALQARRVATACKKARASACMCKWASKAAPAKAAGKTTAKSAAKTAKSPAKKAVKSAAVKAPRKAAVGNLTPSAALAAVIGDGKVARTEVIKKLWDYIKANNLQDATNKRTINADAKLKAVFGKDQVTMFELAGIVGKHVSA